MHSINIFHAGLNFDLLSSTCRPLHAQYFRFIILLQGSVGYLNCLENIFTGKTILFCSYGEIFSRLSGKVSRCEVGFVKCKKVFPLSAKLCSYETKMILDWSPKSRLSASEISVPGKTFHLI